MDESASRFQERMPDIARLTAFGFKKKGERYIYVTPLMNGAFEMTVAVANNSVTAKVMDLAVDEEYTLFRVPGATGAFVGRIRKEYEDILETIAVQCFGNGVFKGEYTKAIIQYALTTYGDAPEYLWEKFPRNAILRRKDNAKWYAAILSLPRHKLGLDGDQIIEILDLRHDPDTLPELIDNIRYFPGYHMNKKHWVTLILDGTLPLTDILRHIDTSYAIAMRSKVLMNLKR